MRRSFWAVVAAGLLLGSAPAYADVWDQDTLNDEDDSSETDNELVHGLRQVHDLGAEAAVVDQDWYRVSSQPRSSYEVLVDGITGDLYDFALPVERVTGTGTLISASIPIPGGSSASRTLRWENANSTAAVEYVRVNGSSSSCTTACTVSDQYTIRFYETTTSIARYNNTGTQTTVVFVQNPTNYSIDGTVWFWSGSGTLVGQQTFTLAAHQLVNISAFSVAGATSGHITISHTGRYGDLQGKSVALEPSTGFSFDTPMITRPY